MGTAYLLFGAGGKTMVPIESSGLGVGQVVSYEDMANPRQMAVVVEAEGDDYGQRCIFIDDHHEGHVSQAILDGPGGWRDEFETVDEIVALGLVDMAAEKRQRQDTARETAEAERQAQEDRGRKALETEQPEWAKAYIVAELQVDDSDIMTDYFASHSSRTVFLGWSKHTRDLFPEMRKAAAKFEPTKHLGPGKDIWTAVVVNAADVETRCGYMHKGAQSHGHSEMYPSDTIDPPKFETEAEAQAFVDNAGEPYSVRDGDIVCDYEWAIRCESVEHREKWSMGKGYYLGASYSGWRVSKRNLPDSGLAMLFGDVNRPTI